MSHAPIGIAIVGSGVSAMRFAAACEKHPRARLRGLVSRSNQGERNGLKSFTFEEALHAPSIDAFILCTPHALHYEQASQILDRRKALLLEKPATVSLTELDRLIEKESKNALPIAVNHPRRFDSLWQDLLPRIKDFGALKTLSVSVPYYREPNYYHDASWRASASQSGGIVFTQAIHALDEALLLHGNEAAHIDSCESLGITVRHAIDFSDTIIAKVQFASKVTLSLYCTTGVAPKGPATVHAHWEKEECLLSEGRCLHATFTLPSHHSLGWGESATVAVLDDFLASIIEGKAPQVTLQKVRPSIALCEAISAKCMA